MTINASKRCAWDIKRLSAQYTETISKLCLWTVMCHVDHCFVSCECIYPFDNKLQFIMWDFFRMPTIKVYHRGKLSCILVKIGLVGLNSKPCVSELPAQFNIQRHTCEHFCEVSCSEYIPAGSRPLASWGQRACPSYGLPVTWDKSPPARTAGVHWGWRGGWRKATQGSPVKRGGGGQNRKQVMLVSHSMPQLCDVFHLLHGNLLHVCSTCVLYSV